MSILAPQFLVRNIGTISIILSSVLMVIFSDFINKNIVFKITDSAKKHTHKKLKKRKIVAKYVSEGIATIIFILYCYFGTVVVARYIIQPIFIRAQAFLLLVVIGVFLLISFMINEKRKVFLKT